MEGSNRVKPIVQTENCPKMFVPGERVEAIWSSDGQRYPGTVVHVYPNDNYEVLFDDGVKSRRKAHLIFKLGGTGKHVPSPKERQTRPSPKASLPVPIVSDSTTAKPKPPPLIPIKAAVVRQSSVGSIPKPPPLICGNNKKTNDSDSPSSSRTASPCTISISTESKTPSTKPLKPKLGRRDTKAKPIEKIIEGTNGSASPSPSLESLEDKSNLDRNCNSPANCTKKGFAYVLQPHYSVFDPPPSDLGKRQRRVHNYSQLAKGPVLKKGLNANGLDESTDEDGSKPNSRCTSPSVGVNSPSSLGSQTYGSVFNTSSDGTKTLALPRNSTNFTRKRRFLTSPTKKDAPGATTTTSTPGVRSSVGKKEVESSVTNTSTSCKSNGSKGALTLSTTSSPITTDTDKKIVKSGRKSGLAVSQKDLRVNSKSSEVNSTNCNSDNAMVVDTLTPTLPPISIPHPEIEKSSDTDVVPGKRLRKPTFKVINADEGYIDIFSRRKNSRSGTSPQKRKRLSESTVDSPTTTTTTPLTPLSPKPHGRKTKGTTSSVSVIEPVLEKPALTRKESANSLSSKNSNCDRSTKDEAKHLEFANISDCSESEEELLDVGEYTVVQEVAKIKNPPRSSIQKKSSRKQSSLSGSARDREAELCQVRRKSNLETRSDDHTSEEIVLQKTSPVAITNSTPLVPQRSLRHLGRGRRWQPPSVPPPNHTTKQSSKTKLAIPEVQILVEKCDSVLSHRLPSSYVPGEKTSHLVKGKIHTSPVEQCPASTSVSTSEVVPLPKSSRYKRRKWGESRSRSRWHKQRQRAGGILPGMRTGMRVNDSLSMQLIKRSRFQRRFEKGRPRVALLTGITKKKLKKIQESVKRRKLKKKKIVAYTKFKDVRVDIINCICGRTDEFGLMVQCEVCLCWQHGNCFDINDGSNLPNFYVCQSCASPKRVRPSHVTEGIRQESYKKGVLPTFPFASKPSSNKERILKRCNELSKAINSIDDAIRQNKIKEQIATAEPEHTKLYQWNTPRTHPKDLLQKWHFNKYYKSVIRRLLRRHKTKPEYLEKLINTLGFREKLKKYSQAFEEARLAITRKVGPRGLILIEKLSDQQVKLSKVNKAKDKLDAQLASLPESMKDSLLSQPFANQGAPSAITPLVSSPAKADGVATRAMIENLIAEYGHFLKDDFEVGTNWDKNDVLDASSSEEDSDVEVLDCNGQSSKERKNCNITNNENALIAQEIHRFNLEQLKDCNVPILDDDEEESWIEMKKTSSNAVDVDMIKLMLGKSPPKVGSSGSGDVESEEGEALSGDTTVSVEDSEGGEEYWYNPITELNSQYDSMRRLLLHDRLLEDDRRKDVLWVPTGSNILKRDWVHDLKSRLDSELELGHPSDQESETTEESSDSETSGSEDTDEDSDLSDATVTNDVTSPDGTESTVSKSKASRTNSCNYWQEAIIALDETPESSEDENDLDWEMEEADTSSEEEDVSTSETEDDDNYMSNSSDFNSSAEATETSPKPSKSSTGIRLQSGVILVTNDPTAKPGDITDVCINIGATETSLGSGIVVGGARGQNFLKILDSNEPTFPEKEVKTPKESVHSNGICESEPQSKTSQIPLCKPCLESLGSKWNWNQLYATKGMRIAVEDPVQTLRDEFNRLKMLGILSTSYNIGLEPPQQKIGTPMKQESISKANSSNPTEPDPIPVKKSVAFEPPKLTELCREILSRPRTFRSRPEGISNKSHPRGILKSHPPPTSAEEESILSLLSLSKTPVQLNGENVSELSIESLRKLTDRLQQNGPLLDDLAKAVAGQPLSNGRISGPNTKFDKLHLSSNAQQSTTIDPMCIRCRLKDETSQKLSILVTSNPELIDTVTPEEFEEFYNKVTKTVELVRGSSHAIRKLMFNKIAKLADRKKAERTAKELGIKITPDSMQKRLQLAKPELYLNQLKSEYVDALMPYATYFISRFTKKDQVTLAKKNWINDMLQNYNKVKKSLKEMFGVVAEEGRLQKEDKFYTALDNLRKSFDIVLTKKDIKMRRKDQSLSLSDNLVPNDGTGMEVNQVKSDVKVQDAEVDDGVKTTISDSINLVNPKDNLDVSVSMDMDTDVESKPEVSENSELAEPSPVQEVRAVDQNPGDCLLPPTSASQPEPTLPFPLQTPEQEKQALEILARLVDYPMGDEDMKVILRLSKGDIESEKSEQSGPISGETSSSSILPLPDSQQSEAPGTNSNSQNDQEEMEVDDLQLLEDNFSQTSDNLVIGGDMDLMNTIGNLGHFKGTEDSDLLLNVFDDPIFSEPDEPTPCCSKSLSKPQQSQFTGPVLTKLTPEMCRGYLLDDIRAHQHIIDLQLDKLEAEIMDLERRRGNGLKEKDDGKLFEVLYANMQILCENTEVLTQLVKNCVGKDYINLAQEVEEPAEPEPEPILIPLPQEESENKPSPEESSEDENTEEESDGFDEEDHVDRSENSSSESEEDEYFEEV